MFRTFFYFFSIKGVSLFFSVSLLNGIAISLCMSIFKAYDIRGVFPSELNEDIAYKFGRAFVSFLSCKEVVVGRDMRLSSDNIFSALARGITDQGASVIDIGVVSTPMVYFACGSLKKPASIMITASHNPAEWNGFKLTREEAIPISGDTGIQDIEKIFTQGEFEDVSEKGNVVSHDISKEYASHISGLVPFDKEKVKGLKVVVDCANAMGCKEVELLKGMCEVVPLFDVLDGNFPNHEADPLKDENTKALQEAVVAEKASLGIAFDGDADRVFFIDEQGRRIPSDFITCLIAEDMLANEKGTILYDLRSSWVVPEIIESLGGKAEMSKVGHAFIKEHLRKSKGIFGGELSGHFYFKDLFYTDSAILAVFHVLHKVSSSGMSISSLVKPLQKYFVSGEINREVDDKEGILELLKKKYTDGKVSLLDGIRVDYDDWWFNVRASNTESLLRLNVEAKTKELMEEKRDELLSFMDS